MSDPYIGEIRMFGGSFAPAGWAFCNGATIPISENDALFTLIGTTYGGDGQETFKLPDLQGRIPIHQGGVSNHVIGELGGVESVTLTTAQIPKHNHPVVATTNQGNLPDPGNNLVARSATPNIFRYTSDQPDVQLAPQSVSPVGGSQPHDNLAPYLCINYIISLFGIFPSQT
jgi:microcystin-dependent protein